MSEKKALCVGIDDYFGTVNDLLTCVKDAKEWVAYFKSLKFLVTLLLNNDGNRNNILTILDNMVVNAQPGDELAYTLSHHGTSIKDKSGDELDKYDEALYVVDGTILDDELREIMDKIPEGVNMTVVADCCFSHTITRMALVQMGKLPPRVRYAQTDFIPPGARLKRKFLREKNEEDMKEIVISACGEWEYAYEGPDGGRLTRVMLDILKKTPNITYNDLIAAIHQKLPSDEYPQTPYLEGSTERKARFAFGGTGAEPQPEPEPEPEEPSSNLPGCRWKFFCICIAIGIIIAAVLCLIF